MARRGNYNAHLGRTFTATMGGQNLGMYSPLTTTWEQALTGAVVANATSLQLVLEAGAEPGNDSMALIDDVAVMPAHPHAARAMGNGNSYEYDANGNMTVRRELSGTETFVYTQTWTVDNRLTSVVKSDATGTILATTTIAYDGEGVRVKKTDPSGATYYLGTVEVLITGTTQVTTSYYAFGGARVAMRDGAAAPLTYLHGDHLGSTSLTTNASGQKVSEQPFGRLRAGCYKPGACPERQRRGEVRWSGGAGMPTDFTFTSQRAGPANYVGSLMDYVARGYSPALGRFISADTIVPGAGNPAAFNRYMYVRGNPLRYADPSGHMDASPDDNGATPGINDWPCGIENDCQMDWNNNAASRFGAGVLDEVGDALKGFFGLASAAANPASVIEAGWRAGSEFGAKIASKGLESAVSEMLGDNPFIGALRSGDYAYAGGRFIGFVSMAGLAGEFAPKGVCSFSPDTPVATEAGLIPIAGVITGTRVLAWDETANATGYYPVTNVWVHWDLVLVVLIIDGETITTTPEHPFYTPMHGWLPAGELWVGAGLRRADGGTGIVESATTVTRTELMWNLTVDVVHTFFVGGGEWLAHNTCGVTSRIRDLQAAGVKDAHHVVQDAAVRDLPGYESLQAPGVSLSGPSTQAGTPHYLATMVQRQAGGGSLGAELRIGYKALRVAGYAEETARRAISEASDWFRSIGATSTTVTRIPGNR